MIPDFLPLPTIISSVFSVYAGSYMVITTQLPTPPNTFFLSHPPFAAYCHRKRRVIIQASLRPALISGLIWR